MPATDIQFEREFEELVRDLRALPTAGPPELRDRVRALGEPTEPRTVRDLLLAIPWRRSLLVLAPVCVLGLVSAAVIHGVLHSGKTNQVASVTSARAALDSGVNGTAGSGAGGVVEGHDGARRQRAAHAFGACADPWPLSGLRGVADRAREGR